MRIALFQPDIPQNTGNILRLAACFNTSVDIIEPAGFFLDNKNLKRSVMDYYKYVTLKRHIDWKDFYTWSQKEKFRIILLTTKGSKKIFEYNFKKNDILLFGRETSGVPKEVHRVAKEKLVIPIKKGLRSLNVSSATAIVLGEAVRQLKMV